MRVFRLRGDKGRRDFDLVDEPVPTPARGQVLVKVAACSLNARDLAVRDGTYRMGNRPNVIPLSDGAGAVVAVGPDVTRVKEGDRVAGCFFQRWNGGTVEEDSHLSALGGSLDGMLADYVVLEQDGVVHVPPHLSLEEAATLPCAAVTAWHALVDHARVVAGQSLLVMGTGGVSLFALQFGRAMGLEVVAISSSDEKLARAKAHGAAHGINYRTEPDWDKAVRAATGGRGVDHVVEIGGPATLERSLSALAPGGKAMMVGFLAGAASINPMAIAARRADVKFISVGSRQMFEAMNRAIAVNHIRPVIDRVFPFTEAAQSYEYMLSGAHFGKIVLRID